MRSDDLVCNYDGIAMVIELRRGGRYIPGPSLAMKHDVMQIRQPSGAAASQETPYHGG